MALGTANGREAGAKATNAGAGTECSRGVDHDVVGHSRVTNGNYRTRVRKGPRVLLGDGINVTVARVGNAVGGHEDLVAASTRNGRAGRAVGADARERAATNRNRQLDARSGGCVIEERDSELARASGPDDARVTAGKSSDVRGTCRVGLLEADDAEDGQNRYDDSP